MVSLPCTVLIKKFPHAAHSYKALINVHINRMLRELTSVKGENSLHFDQIQQLGKKKKKRQDRSLMDSLYDWSIISCQYLSIIKIVVECIWFTVHGCARAEESLRNNLESLLEVNVCPKARII